MHPLLTKLEGGDRRSIGRSQEVVEHVLADVSLFPALFEGMVSSDPVVRMRAADAAEKVAASRPDLLQPFADRLLDKVAAIDQQEVRWHVAQMLPRLRLTDAERARAVALLEGYLGDKSKIVQTFALQALADLAQQDVSLVPRVIGTLEEMIVAGSPAVRSRSRKLLALLGE